MDVEACLVMPDHPYSKYTVVFVEVIDGRIIRSGVLATRGRLWKTRKGAERWAEKMGFNVIKSTTCQD